MRSPGAAASNSRTGVAERRDEMRRRGIALGPTNSAALDLAPSAGLPPLRPDGAAPTRVVRVVMISGSILSSMIAARRAASAASKAGANSSVRATAAPKAP